MDSQPRHARFTRALALGCASSMIVAACEPSREAAPNTFSTAPTTSGDRASAERDAAAVEDSGVAANDPRSPTDTPEIVNGSPCTTVGASRTFGDPRDQTHCSCMARGASNTWSCYTDSMAIEGPLPPPDLVA